MKLKVWTLVGTRPEIIRLAPTMKLFDEVFEHKIIHTGQNFGDNMSDIFFRDLDLRLPDYHLEATGNNLGGLLGDMFSKLGSLLETHCPDAVVILGDTNSGLLTILAKREGIATYHLEAGNRSFDARVPEETNRKIIDHTADFNLAYNNISFQNLIREGIQPGRIFITGSPMREVIDSLSKKIAKSDVLERLNIKKGSYLVGSFHRQENVDDENSLRELIFFANGICEKIGMDMILPLHPRTSDKVSKFRLKFGDRVRAIEPLGIVDYLTLQKSSYVTISDSGTIAEESAILGFKSVSSREATERHEAYHLGAISLSGKSIDNCLEAIDLARRSKRDELPEGYEETRFSLRVANIIISTARRRDFLTGNITTKQT